MVFDFQSRTYSAFGKEARPMKMTASGHPQMSLLEFAEGGPFEVYVMSSTGESEESN
jgi:hypothetical protein